MSSTDAAPVYATFYDASAPSEQPVPLPSAPLETLSLPGVTLQPPLSRRGTGPGLIVILPPSSVLDPHEAKGLDKPLDPEPVQKWAEEGYAVVGVQLLDGGDAELGAALKVGIAALEQCPTVDIKGKFGVLVYDPAILPAVVAAISSYPSLVAVISHGAPLAESPVPALAHVLTEEPKHASVRSHKYDNVTSPYFVIPSSGPDAYSPSSASVAHTRSLVFLRQHIGGPFFDLETIWDEHTFYEFIDRSVAKTMGTMVAEPYVNHVPTMTGGIGRKALSEFYRDHFIFNNPEDAELIVVSRTIGADRVVDEFVYRCTHNKFIDWLLPGVPPTGKKLDVPMMAVVNVRGDRLYHEHIWWDQATALQQVGYLPEYVPFGPEGKDKLRIPTDGYQSSRMLLDETDGKANFMFGSDWGVQRG